MPHGYRTIELHGERYFEHGGVYFRAAPGGYILVDPPSDLAIVATPSIGTVAATLPLGAVAVTVGGNIFYRHGNVFYRRNNAGYVVIEPPPSTITVPSEPAPPQVISAEPAPTASSDYVSVWVGDQEYLTRDGLFYKKAPEGLRRVDAPPGTVVSALRPGVWICGLVITNIFILTLPFTGSGPPGMRWSRPRPTPTSTSRAIFIRSPRAT